MIMLSVVCAVLFVLLVLSTRQSRKLLVIVCNDAKIIAGYEDTVSGMTDTISNQAQQIVLLQVVAHVTPAIKAFAARA